MATLHVICGKPGAGKTTFARELGGSLPAIVFCEDEWISTLGFTVQSLEDYLDASGRCRKLIGPLFEAAGAEHVLHWLEASDAECLANIHRRNDEKPAGVYWGAVSDELFHAVNPHVVPPSADEGFHVIRVSRRGGS